MIRPHLISVEKATESVVDSEKIFAFNAFSYCTLRIDARIELGLGGCERLGDHNKRSPSATNALPL